MQHIDSLKKENFNIKLKVHFLEERLAQLAPDQIDAALKQNINLKIEVQQRGMEMKKLKKLVLELERELERLQKQLENSQQNRTNRQGRERDLEERLEERERELRDLRRQIREGADSEAVATRNAELEEQVADMKVLMEDNMDELDHFRELLAQKERGQDDQGALEELQAENAELRAQVEDRDALADECESLRLQLEELERRHEASTLERSQSRAQIMHAQEEMEAVEDDLNSVRDKLAAAQIEISQKDDEIEMKNREIEELVEEHKRIVDQVEEEWKGEVDEARGQVEELRDVSTRCLALGVLCTDFQQVLETREAEARELRVGLADLEAALTDSHEKFEATMAHLEQESEDKDAEIEAANREIEGYGQRIYELEEENERIIEESKRLREDETTELERLEALSNALKDVRLFAIISLAMLKGSLFRKSQLSRHGWRSSHTSLRTRLTSSRRCANRRRNLLITSRSLSTSLSASAPTHSGYLPTGTDCRRRTTMPCGNLSVPSRRRTLRSSPHSTTSHVLKHSWRNAKPISRPSKTRCTTRRRSPRCSASQPPAHASLSSSRSTGSNATSSASRTTCRERGKSLTIVKPKPASARTCSTSCTRKSAILRHSLQRRLRRG